MNKRRLHHYVGMLRGVKTWQLVIIALLLSVASIGLLRANSITAVRLFQDVKQADKQGAQVYEELRKLQRYVSQHMNTHLERIALEETYKRDYQAALQALADSGSTQDIDYQALQDSCHQQFPGSYIEYARCVSAEVAQVAPGENPELEAKLPQPVRYQYSFVSPAWSPDAAGITLLITGIVWLIILLKTGLQLALVALIRRHHS